MGENSPSYQPGRPLAHAWKMTVAVMMSTNTKPTMLMYSSCAHTNTQPVVVGCTRRVSLSGTPKLVRLLQSG